MTDHTPRPFDVDSLPQGLLIGGRWLPATGGATFPVENPVTGEPVARVADAGTTDALDVLGTAVGAQPQWAATSPRRRPSRAGGVGSSRVSA
ncbi:aldehyde dehydrogenase family protein [Streptomyces fulvorobeus]|uniref:Aldehyde dehydrogenase domain-containing protein n=1 Tax=Streptomyces fulvorobeus TaxID=284028 RepID=A0A7J0CFN1_9ACTN|nr:aldehyde dehydrogenase family protein [Streptomyces fulvorobeus]GFN01313.1 hypothetical protein Sfulv_61230 [Streptomyces fulvorobeus]